MTILENEAKEKICCHKISEGDFLVINDEIESVIFSSFVSFKWQYCMDNGLFDERINCKSQH